MARVDPFAKLTRADIQGALDEAESLGKRDKASKKDHIKKKLEVQFPGIEAATVRRNGRVYSVMEYLTEDLDSYAGSRS